MGEVDWDGYLYKRSGTKAKKQSNKWYSFYITIIGGSLHAYEDIEDEKPKVSIHFKEYTFSSKEEGKDHAFSFKKDDTLIVFAADEEQDYQECLKVIEANKGKEPTSPLPKEKKKSRASKWAQKAKKNVGVKIATSAVGKKALKSIAPEEMVNLIKALRVIADKETGDPKKGAIVEKNLFKLVVKAYFIVDSGKLKFEDFLDADKPLRQALNLLLKCYDHAKFARSVKQEQLKEKLIEVENFIKEAANTLKKLLSPHMKEKNVNRLDEVINIIGKADVLLKVFQDESISDEVSELMDAIERYTQFHFYKD